MAEPGIADAGTWISLVTYNEAENLPLVLEQVLAAVPQAHVVIVDDNSPDVDVEFDNFATRADVAPEVDARDGLELGQPALAGLRDGDDALGLVDGQQAVLVSLGQVDGFDQRPLLNARRISGTRRRPRRKRQ